MRPNICEPSSKTGPTAFRFAGTVGGSIPSAPTNPVHRLTANSGD